MIQMDRCIASSGRNGCVWSASMQAALFKVDFGANQNDADGVELTDWDVIGTWTFDEFNNGNAQWNLRISQVEPTETSP